MKTFKHVFSLIVLCFLSASSYTQTPQTSWIRHHAPYGSPNIISDLSVDANGNVYVCGWISGANGSRDFCTIKYDGSGAVTWTKEFNGSDNSTDQAVTLLNDDLGNVYVCGFSWSKQNDYDIVTIKYDNAGVVLWTKVYDADHLADQPKAIAKDQAGNVYIVAASETGDSRRDIVTLEYSSAGELQWAKRFNVSPNSVEECVTLTVMSNGDTYVGGDTWEQGSASHVCLVKYDQAGTELLRSVYDPSATSSEYLSGMKLNTDGSLYLASTAFPGYPVVDLTKTDHTIRKVNANTLAQLWDFSYDPNTNTEDYLSAIDLDGNGNPVIVGGTSTASSKLDLKLLKRDPANNPLLDINHNYTPKAFEFATDVHVTQTDKVVVGGWRFTQPGDREFITLSFSSDGTLDWMVPFNFASTTSYDKAVKVTSDGTGNVYAAGYTRDDNGVTRFTTIKNPVLAVDVPWRDPNPEYSFSLSQNYPNPFGSNTTVQYSLGLDCNAKLSIVDPLGVEVALLTHTMQRRGVYSISWTNSTLASGVYFLRLEAGSFFSTIKLIITK